MAMCAATPRVYDHRVRELICATGDPSLFPELAIPRSTSAGWLREGAREVVTAEVFSKTDDDLRLENLKLKRRLAVVTAVLRLVVTLLRVFDVRLDGQRLPTGAAKASVLKAVQSASNVMPKTAALRVLRLSPSRYHAWKRAEQCGLDDRSSCPHLSPTQLSVDEVEVIEDMVTSDEYRHVPLSRLAVLAQRLEKVYASATTWCKLVREHGWRRPRRRLYPDKPKEGIKATAPNQYWHLDVTVIKLLDGTKVYLHGVIDNFSRRLLAWKLATTLCPSSTCEVLLEAGKALIGGAAPPMVVTDSGVENVNKEVDALQEKGTIKRILALVEVDYSNSKIEAFWRSLRHQWLYLNCLDSLAALQRLVAFYVQQHNEAIPHSALGDKTPNEAYFGSAHDISEELAVARYEARHRRMQINRDLACDDCRGRRGSTQRRRGQPPACRMRTTYRCASLRDHGQADRRHMRLVSHGC